MSGQVLRNVFLTPNRVISAIALDCIAGVAGMQACVESENRRQAWKLLQHRTACKADIVTIILIILWVYTPSCLLPWTKLLCA